MCCRVGNLGGKEERIVIVNVLSKHIHGGLQVKLDVTRKKVKMCSLILGSNL